MTRAAQVRSCLILGILVLVAHGPALRTVEFHFDDGHSVVRNPHLRDLSNLPRFFADPALFGENPGDAMYRPLVLAAHAINRAWAGERPAGYVALNLCLHLIATLLAGAVLRQLGLGQIAALAGAALFGLHPLQTEIVNYISARSESIAAVGLLLGVLSLLRHRNASDERWLSGVALGQAIALGGKEIGVVLPLLLLILMPGTSHRSRDRRALLAAVAVLVPYLIFQQSFRTAAGRPNAGLLPDLRPWLAQASTQVKALVYYLRGMITPVDLSVYPQFRVSASATEPAVWVALVALVSGAGLLWHARSGRRAAVRGAIQGAAWWVLCLLPTLVIPLNVLVNDHRPYTALLGGVLMLGRLPLRWPEPPLGRLGAVLSVILVLLCWQRAGDWRTELSLWTAAVREGPAVPQAHYNLAFAEHRQGDLAAAQSHYEQALRLDPEYDRPLVNLGAIYREKGDLERAEAILRRAVVVDPGAVAALNNLGLVYAARGEFDRAIQTYQIALQADETVAEVWLNLGLSLRDAGRRQEAFECLQRAVQLDPGIRQRLGAAP